MNTQIENSPARSADDKKQLCYEVVKNAYDFTFTNIDNLDEKASNLILFAGAILGLYSGFGQIVLSSVNKEKFFYINVYFFNNFNYYNSLMTLLIIGLLILLTSIGCALFAYKLIDMFATPEALYFYNHYVVSDKDKYQILDSLTAALVSAIENNKPFARRKEVLVNWSFVLLWIGSIVSVIFVIIALYTSKVS